MQMLEGLADLVPFTQLTFIELNMHFLLAQEEEAATEEVATMTETDMEVATTDDTSDCHISNGPVYVRPCYACRHNALMMSPYCF
jgi:hypothetical protein